MASRFVTLLIMFSLAACSNTARQPTFLPTVANATAAHAGGDLVLRVTVSRSGRTPHYIGSSTKAISLVITGPTTVNKVAGLTLGAKGCISRLMTLECVLKVALTACPSKKPCYDASVATYDAYNAAKNKIPRGARELSAKDHFSFSIGSGNTLIPLVLEGIPKSIAFVPSATSTLSGNQAGGFVEPKCTASSQNVSVMGLDADGNYIVGAGAPAVSLKSGDPAQFAIVKKGSNVFELNPPAAPGYPFGNDTVYLTAKARPGPHSGAKAVTAVFAVAYSGDICGVLDEFTVPTTSSEPLEIAAGPDGAVWFTESNGNKIGRITTAGSISEYSIPTGGSVPAGIVMGADKNLWFTEAGTGSIGRITTSGTVTEFTLPTTGTPLYITAGPDGNLWYTDYSANKVGNITTLGVAKEFTIPTSGSAPRGISPGPNGDLWFAECNGNKLGEINTSGTIAEHTLAITTAQPFGVAEGPDGRIWMAQRQGNAIAVMSSAAVTTSYFILPAASSYPAGIVSGPDGAMWFTEEAGRVGRLTVGGDLTEYPLSGGGSTDVFGITVGPDGAIWFAETLGNAIGRIR